MKSPEMKSPLVEDNKKQKSSKKLTKEKNLEPEIWSKEWEERLISNTIKLIKKDKFPKDWTKDDYLIQIVENILEKSEAGEAYASSKEIKKLIKENKDGIIKKLEAQLSSQESESNENELVNEYINSPEVRMQMINISKKLQNEYGDNLYLYLKKLEKIVDSDKYKNQILNNPKIRDNNNKEEQANILINAQKKFLSFFEKRAKADYEKKRELSKIESKLEEKSLFSKEDEKKNNENSKNNEIIKKLSEEITAMSADFTLWIWTKIKNEKQDEKQDTENILSYVKNLD